MTKVVTGIKPGDVANHVVRCVLTGISASLYGNITEDQMNETMDYFDWKCPYTGRDLRESIKNNDGTYVADHIIPQNRMYCGLNIKGNIIYVDKEANANKHNKSVEEFMLNDQSVLKGVSLDERKKRLQRIKDFQNECDYNPEEVKRVLSDHLQEIYSNTTQRLDDYIQEMINRLKGQIFEKNNVPKTVQTIRIGQKYEHVKHGIGTVVNIDSGWVYFDFNGKEKFFSKSKIGSELKLAFDYSYEHQTNMLNNLRRREQDKSFSVKDKYKKWLGFHNYRPTTINSYISNLKFVCNRERISWQTLADNIGKYVKEYGPYGSKVELGERGHNACICALKRFKEMIDEIK